MVRSLLTAITMAATSFLAAPAWAQELRVDPDTTACNGLKAHIESLSIGGMAVFIDTTPAPDRDMLFNPAVGIEQPVSPQDLADIRRQNAPSWIIAWFVANETSFKDILDGKLTPTADTFLIQFAFAQPNDCRLHNPMAADLANGKDRTIAFMAAKAGVLRAANANRKVSFAQAEKNAGKNSRAANLKQINAYITDEIRKIIIKRLGAKQ